MDLYKSSLCWYDYIEVRDGYWRKSPLLGKRLYLLCEHESSLSLKVNSFKSHLRLKNVCGPHFNFYYTLFQPPQNTDR